MMNLLCADDEPWTVVRELERLQGYKFRTTVVSSVTKALQELSSGSRYDVIVVDVINRAHGIGEPSDPRIPEDASPRTMGLVFCEILRKDPAFKDLPVVFYTVLNDSKIRTRIKELGGMYVTKRESLADHIRTVFGTGAK